MTASLTALAPEVVVRRWVQAFNAQDLKGMLACVDPRVSLYPLRLGGLDGSYRGHDGVRRWFARLRQLRHEHVIVLSDVQGAGDGKVIAVGALTLPGNFDAAPFCGLHRIADGLILRAYHYLTDPEMLQHLGLVP